MVGAWLNTNVGPWDGKEFYYGSLVELVKEYKKVYVDLPDSYACTESFWHDIGGKFHSGDLSISLNGEPRIPVRVFPTQLECDVFARNKASEKCRVLVLLTKSE